jgi:type I restriction enzyme S subunit
VAIPQLKNGRLDLTDVRRISRDHFIEWTRKARPETDDVILSRRCNPGETAVVPPGLECALGQNLVLLRADGTKVFPPFLRWLVRGPDWWEQVGKFINVGAVFDSLKCADIPNFRLPLPPISEQRGIASILGALDDKIDLNRRMNETLEAMARAIFKDWFVDFGPVRAKAEGRLPPGLSPDIAALFPDTLDGEDKPTGWRIEAVGKHIANFDSKRIPISGAERETRKGPYPYHGAAGVMDCIDGYLFDGIFLLVGEDGSVVRSDGTAVTQYVNGRFWVNNHAHVLQGSGAVCTEHLFLYFQMEQVAPYITGAVQPKLSQGRMNTMPFMFPGENLCRAFSDLVDALFARIRSNEAESKTLAQLRDLLLPKLMSGEIRLKEAEKAVEAVV